MPIDGNIALSGKPVDFDTSNLVNLIAQGQQRRMQQESHAQQMQIGQQHIAAGELASQEARLKQQDDQRMMKAYQDAQGEPAATIKNAVAAGVRPQAVQASEKHFADIAEQKAKTGKDQLDTEKYRNDQMLGLHDQAESMLQQDPAAFAQQWPQLFAAAKQIDPETAKHFDPNTPPTLEQIQGSKLAHVTHGYLIQQADQKIKQAGEQRASMMAGPQLDKATAEAQSAKDKAAGKSPIQPEEQARLDLQARANEQTAVHNKATEQNATALLKVSQGNLGVAQEHAAIAKQIYEQTYGAGANPALVGVEPKLRVQASTAAQKAADEYTKTVESAANVQSFIDLAKKGNKAAGSNLPIMGAESIQALNGIKRINRSEIEQYQGAGSLLDKIQGRIGKITSGQPIPKDVMDDIQALHQTMAGNAANAYNTKLGSINQNYRSNFQPVKVTEAPASSGHKAGDVVTIGGKKVKITAIHADGTFDGDEVK